MTQEEIIKVLDQSKLFYGCNKEQLKKVASAANSKDYASEQAIYRFGQPSEDLFVVVEGVIAIREADTEVAVKKQYDVVGEIGILTDSPRSADVFAKTNVKIISLTRPNFLDLLDDDPILGLIVYKNTVKLLSGYLRKINRLWDYQFKDLSKT